MSLRLAALVHGQPYTLGRIQSRKFRANMAVMEAVHTRDEPIALAHKARRTERQKPCSWFAITTNSSLHHRVPVFSSSSRTTATVSAPLLSRIQSGADKCPLDRLGQIPKEQSLGLIREYVGMPANWLDVIHTVPRKCSPPRRPTGNDGSCEVYQSPAL